MGPCLDSKERMRRESVTTLSERKFVKEVAVARRDFVREAWSVSILDWRFVT